MQPDRLTIYLALGVVAAGIAAVTGPSPALLTLLQVVGVVECINLVAAPGDDQVADSGPRGRTQGEQ